MRDTQKAMVTYDNFDHATMNRETGKPERGYGSVLPRHTLQHDKRHLSTTHSVDYQYPFDWSPKQEVQYRFSELNLIIYLLTTLCYTLWVLL